MKILSIALKLFRQKIVLNFVLIFEIALVAVITVVISNISIYSSYSINTIRESCDRIFYYMYPPIENADEEAQIRNELNDKLMSFKWLKGVSKIGSWFIYFDKNMLEEQKPATGKEAANIIEVDDETAHAIRYPLSEGKWFADVENSGYVPCVIGGIYANEYKVGDKIRGYSYDGNQYSIQMVDLMVVGKLAKPEQVLSLSKTYVNISFPASSLFESMINNDLFIIAQRSQLKLPSVEVYNSLIYIDKSCPQEELQTLQNELSRSYALMDTQLIEAEKVEVNQLMKILMPFIIMLFLLSLTGITTMCMLTTLQNIQLFRIYYLVGCSRYKTVIITAVYSFIYFFASAALFMLILKICYWVEDARIMNVYFIPDYKSTLIISIIYGLISILSFVIPFFLIRKRNTIDILKMN